MRSAPMLPMLCLLCGLLGGCKESGGSVRPDRGPWKSPDAGDMYPAVQIDEHRPVITNARRVVVARVGKPLELEVIAADGDLNDTLELALDHPEVFMGHSLDALGSEESRDAQGKVFRRWRWRFRWTPSAQHTGALPLGFVVRDGRLWDAEIFDLKVLPR